MFTDISTTGFDLEEFSAGIIDRSARLAESEETLTEFLISILSSHAHKYDDKLLEYLDSTGQSLTFDSLRKLPLTYDFKNVLLFPQMTNARFQLSNRVELISNYLDYLNYILNSKPKSSIQIRFCLNFLCLGIRGLLGLKPKLYLPSNLEFASEPVALLFVLYRAISVYGRMKSAPMLGTMNEINLIEFLIEHKKLKILEFDFVNLNMLDFLNKFNNCELLQTARILLSPGLLEKFFQNIFINSNYFSKNEKFKLNFQIFPQFVELCLNSGPNSPEPVITDYLTLIKLILRIIQNSPDLIVNSETLRLFDSLYQLLPVRGAPGLDSPEWESVMDGCDEFEKELNLIKLTENSQNLNFSNFKKYFKINLNFIQKLEYDFQSVLEYSSDLFHLYDIMFNELIGKFDSKLFELFQKISKQIPENSKKFEFIHSIVSERLFCSNREEEVIRVLKMKGFPDRDKFVDLMKLIELRELLLNKLLFTTRESVQSNLNISINLRMRTNHRNIFNYKIEKIEFNLINLKLFSRLELINLLFEFNSNSFLETDSIKKFCDLLSITESCPEWPYVLHCAVLSYVGHGELDGAASLIEKLVAEFSHCDAWRLAIHLDRRRAVPVDLWTRVIELCPAVHLQPLVDYIQSRQEESGEEQAVDYVTEFPNLNNDREVEKYLNKINNSNNFINYEYCEILSNIPTLMDTSAEINRMICLIIT
jgi:hypothetical protein